MTSTDSLTIMPTEAVSDLYFSHSQSTYFGIGKINKVQVEEYANRKKIPFEVIEKWLGPALGY